MPRISDIEGLKVTGRKGKLFGRVEHVLFAPTEPRVAGLEIRPPSIGLVIERKPRYLVLEAVERTDEGFAIREGHHGTKPDFSWDDSVVWRYMPVVSADGRSLGFVKDIEFDLADGCLRRLWLSRGAVDEAAVGGAVVDAVDIDGFDGETVRLLSSADKVTTSGGSARTAGRGAAIAKIAAQETAKQAVGGAVEIAKAVKRGEVGKRAAKGWKAFRDSIAEGMKDEE